MPVRRIARPLFASSFIAEGWDAVSRPDPHVARTRACWQELGPRLGLPPVPSTDTLRLVVRVHGGVMALAAVMVATGRAPRTAALTLAGLCVPLAVVDQPFGTSARVAAATAEGADTAGSRERFLRTLTMIGGALVVGLDREGRPGLTWRASHALEHRAITRRSDASVAAATKEARLAVTAAKKEAKAALRQARRASSAVD